MEQESFEDEKVAAILNEHFIAIKVDREERPDIDQIYMGVCQAMTGQGGWPLTIVMTPDKEPFFAGTYFPRERRYGRAGLLDLLPRLHDIWTNEREKALEIASDLVEKLNSSASTEKGQPMPERTVIEQAYAQFVRSFDAQYGGFGQAPKFPSAHNLLFLLRHYAITHEKQALEMVTTTLENMYAGGIWDHIGYGFARYSTDAKWLVPHFEKMLYDNAMLAHAYLEAFQVTGNELFAQIARHIFTFVTREMTSAEGGFYSAIDADSEGIEGKFYVFSPRELESLLGKEQAESFCRHFGITVQGNFEEGSIPNLLNTPKEEWMISSAFREYASSSLSHAQELERNRQKVFAYREQRVHPHKDDKVLTSWNALMISAFAKGARILKEATWLDVALRARQFIDDVLIRPDGRLMARYRDHETKHLAYLEDYVYLAWAELELYDATYDFAHVQRSMHWMREARRLFYDEIQGGFFFYGSDGEKLLTRPKELYDGALPSGNSIAFYVLQKLTLMTGQKEWEDLALGQIHAFYDQVQEYPSGYAQFLMGLQLSLYKTQEIVIAAPTLTDARPFLDFLAVQYLPQSITLVRTTENRMQLANSCPYTADQEPQNGQSTVYFCEAFACRKPIIQLEELRTVLAQQTNC
ncbi:hypothetical protein BM613_10955 [Sulfoacidibacillus thermotolerans]|uniref:Spermatogenesis-associated protein 20-like TRX domain-containing protein n=1 Tax=Sulfoacidibacillus thermotolerans TaxID=1765684 RepID=A0A2U3D6V1_SULT2|nr:hypothetical protein BM613_10955 [Sulfoacidibacillus thermotolerans]